MIVFRLKEILKQKGWTRYELQKRSKITYPTLHALFHDRNNGYTKDVLNKLCYTLHCRPNDLLEWKPDRFERRSRKSN